MIPYSTKVNRRPIGNEVLITAETHVIGIVGVSTVMANTVKLIEVPRQDIVSSIVIPGYSETTNPSPGTGEFYVDYINGYLTFNASANGNTVQVTYYGKGSEVDAVDINEVQEPLSIGMDIDGTLTPKAVVYGVLTVVNPPSITTSNVDNYTGLVVVASSTVIVSIPTPTDVTTGRFFTILNKSTSTQSITVNGNVLLVGYGATFLWDGSAWLLISPIPGTTGVPVLASDPGSPFMGQIYFNSTSGQFIGWSGSSWVILG